MQYNRLQRLQFYALDLIAFTSNNSNFRNLTYILFASRSVFQLVDWALRLRCSDMDFCAFESLGDFIVDNAACLYTSHQSIAAPVAPANSPCYSPRVCPCLRPSGSVCVAVHLSAALPRRHNPTFLTIAPHRTPQWPKSVNHQRLRLGNLKVARHGDLAVTTIIRLGAEQ